MTSPPANSGWTEKPDDGPPSSGFGQILLLLLIIGVAIALYVPMLDDYFQTDDFIFLRATRYADFQQYVLDSFDFTGYNEHDEVVDFLRDDDIALPFLSYRPLYFVSLKAMSMAFGDSVTGYHLVSLGVHIANIALVWLIAKRLIAGSVAPLVAAALFALHPAYVPAVAWISDIGTPGATLFSLLALLLFMKSTEERETDFKFYAASIAALLAAMLFHQQSITWTAVIVAYGFLSGYRSGERLPFLNAWRLAVPFIVIAVSAALLQSYINAHTPVHNEELGVGTHMVTHLKNLGSGSVLPLGTANDAIQLAGLAGLSVLLLGTPALWLWAGDRWSFQSAAFCSLWYVAALTPLLTLDDFFGPATFYRKLYVIGPSLAILLALAGQAIIRLVPFAGRPAWAATGSLVVVLTLVASVYWAGERRDEVSEIAGIWETYTGELRDRYPALPEGTTVYVVSPPEQTRSFGDVYIVASAQAMYGKVDAVVLDRWREGQVEPSVFERVFHYPRDPAASRPE